MLLLITPLAALVETVWENLNPATVITSAECLVIAAMISSTYAHVSSPLHIQKCCNICLSFL